ncbi:hypothetical protein ACHQM5_018547 [Ranunculus cassubicifolius]
MASSLQDLLAEEGFKGRKFNSQRSSFGSDHVSKSKYNYKDKKRTTSGPLVTSSSVKIKTERTRSDLSRYNVGSEFAKTKGVRSNLPRDSLLGNRRDRKELNMNDSEEDDDSDGIDDNGLHNVQRLNSRLLVDIPGYGVANGRRRSDAHESQKYKDIFSNDVFESDGARNESSNGFEENEKYKYGSNKLLLGRPSASSKTLKKPMSFTNKSTKGSHSKMQPDVGPSGSEPALDEAAIKAIVSILTDYVRPYLKDKEFRESVRDICFSCLVSTTLEENQCTDNKVIPNLEEAIDRIERFAEDSGDVTELKKASFQLSVITSLSSNELKYGFSAGIPNAHLSAGAHLYLGVVYKLLKKDKVSAKHLLQVFCDSPQQARTTLLPELWDYLFHPNLAHLKVWYDQEASSIPDTSSKSRKLKLLEKVYNEILDSGTFQFAVYYKDWLTEGVAAPAVPSIHIPSVSFQGSNSKGSLHGHSSELASPISSSSSQSMISKKLYEAVFVHSNKLDRADEVEGGEEEEFDNCESSFAGIAEEEKKTVPCSPELETCTEQKAHGDTTLNVSADASKSNGGLLYTTEEVQQLSNAISQNQELKSGARVSSLLSATPGRDHPSQVQKKADDFKIKKLAETVFRQPQTRNSTSVSASTQLSQSKLSLLDSFKLNNISSHVEEHDEYQEDGYLFSNVPKDFMCPLTGELFDDPVTLETGQTYERMAIKEWFDNGKGTCPITGKSLESLGVPITNYVLKRVIDNWKSEHRRNLLVVASSIENTSSDDDFKSKDQRAVMVLEQLLIGFKNDERLTNAKHLISMGGLQFLILRFELGTLEEKSRIIVLLSCCIEADGACRNYIAKNISKTCLLELLHNKQAKSRANAVKLLTELICLHRRTEVTSFLSSMQKEGLMNTMHVLLVYLQISPSDQRPLIAILLLHFDLLVEPRKYSIYREEAVDSLTVALESSITDEKVRAQCCKALLILGGHMSFSGELLIDNWLLKHAGFYDGRDTDGLDNDDENSHADKGVLLAEEEKAREDWWKSLAASLLGNGKKSFLEIVSKCLASGESSLVRICLITVAWLSQGLVELPNAEFQLSAFSALIPRLKETLENGEQVEYRVLASMALLNFSRISECRVLLMTIREEILIPLQSLAVVTWTAKQLHTIISGERL